MLPATRGGLLITVLPVLPGIIFGAKPEIDDVEFERVGLAGLTVVAAAAGLGGGSSMLEGGLDGERWWLTLGSGLSGAF